MTGLRTMPADAGPSSPPPLRAMLAVSRAVAAGGPLETILDGIAREATRVVPGADRASVILIEGADRRFRLAGRHGLGASYVRLLSAGEAKLRPGDGPSGIAFVTRAPVVVDDVRRDPRIASWTWREIVSAEGYGAIISLPLLAADRVVGTLNLYRTAPGPWSGAQVGLLVFFAEHAASAVRTAQLLDERREQLVALRRIVRALREQTHEHANRLHAIDGLLGIGAIDDAGALVRTLKTAHVEMREALDRRIGVPMLAGLILAQSAVGGQRGIDVELDERSHLPALPASLREPQLVTIVGNLLDNAFDAVAGMDPPRRRVRIRVDPAQIAVTDWGDGLPADATALFARGATTKDDHAGIGLALVSEAAAAARGALAVERRGETTTFRVTFDG
jgi:GAF domain-containing protein